MNTQDPNHPDFVFSRLYSTEAQKESALKKHGKRILGGMACSVAVYFFMHIGVVVGVLRWTCEIGGRVLGRPGSAVKLDNMEEKLAHAIEKGKERVKNHEHPADGLIAQKLAPVMAPVKQAVAVAKTAGEVVEKAKAVEKKAEAIKEKVAETGDKVVDAIKGAGNSAKAGVVGIGAGIAGFAHARAEKKEKDARERLEAQAALIGLEVDPTWTFPRLQGEVLKAEIEWQKAHGPNAHCPRKGCRYAFRIKSKRSESWRCQLCGLIFTTRQALAAGKANMPRSIHAFDRG